MNSKRIKAIETRYAGCRFRSRLEARWAVFFDHAGIEWRYEPEGFHTPDGPYLPDFWLPKAGTWIEVKGAGLTNSELIRCAHVAEDVAARGQQFRLLIGDIPRTPFPLGGDVAHIQCAIWAGDADVTNNLDTALGGGGKFGAKQARRRFRGLAGDDAIMIWMPTNFERVPQALAAARSARFEHGERG